MKTHQELQELIDANVITEDIAEKIEQYYESKRSSSPNRLFLVFGILGALLIGLGIIMIVAHNWDNLSRAVKTACAFLPMVIGQFICAYIILKKHQNTVWGESATVFLCFAIGANLALVSQIYNLEGSLGSFYLTWTLLCIPLIYVMRSSVASMLCIVGITLYAITSKENTSLTKIPYFYWPLLLTIIPHFIMLIKKSPKSNNAFFHNWLIAISLTIGLTTLVHDRADLLFIAYFSLFGIFYLIGNLDILGIDKLFHNGFLIMGSVGSVILLVILSFDFFWSHLRTDSLDWSNLFSKPEFIASIILTLVASILLFMYVRRKELKEIRPLASLFLLFIITYVIGTASYHAVILINIFLFTIGLLVIREGAKRNHFGILNYGLLILTTLIFCRFADTDLSFILRGILFIVIGISFFIVNYWMLNKRKAYE